MEENTTPDTEVVEVANDGGNTEVTTESTEDGQGETGSASSQTYKDYDTFIKDKGWDPETANEQILKSYQDLEKKLGNWKEVETGHQTYQQILEKYGDIDQLAQRAQAWDRAQAYLEQMEAKGEVEPGEMNLSALPVERLAQLWEKGVIGLADIPKEHQLSVQRYVQAQQTAFEEHTRSEAQRLQEKYPILKDPEVAPLIADQIETGVTVNGKELSPDEIVERFQKVLQRSEKAGEERIRQDTQMIKEGNLESSDAAIKTKPVVKVTSIRDAFQAAKREIEEGI